MRLMPSLLAAAATLAAVGAAQAQATVKADGQMRSAITLGASFSSGNSSTRNLALAADAVRLTDQDKTTFYGNAQYARSAGQTTAEQMRLGGRYDWNLNADWFAFGGLDLERNKFADLKLRTAPAVGLGWHVVKTPAMTFDVFGGLAYNMERYFSKDSYNYASLVLGEESTHKLSDTTSFKQRLVVKPNLKDSGEFLATWDAGLSVSMSKAMALTVGFNATHNSLATNKKTDTLLTTGLSVKFD